jgi:hypothetical protein
MSRPTQYSAVVKYRLQLLAPDILQQLQTLNQQDLRRVALAACRFALEKSGLVSAPVREALGYLEAGQPVPMQVRTSLARHVEALDGEYFDLHDKAEAEDPVGMARGIGHEDDQWVELFEKARAAASVQFACNEDPLTAAAEAVCEANHATHDETDRHVHEVELRPALRTAIMQALANA